MLYKFYLKTYNKWCNCGKGLVTMREILIYHSYFILFLIGLLPWEEIYSFQKNKVLWIYIKCHLHWLFNYSVQFQLNMKQSITFITVYNIYNSLYIISFCWYLLKVVIISKHLWHFYYFTFYLQSKSFNNWDSFLIQWNDMQEMKLVFFLYWQRD